MGVLTRLPVPAVNLGRSFNPLHRGMGVLTPGPGAGDGLHRRVSILYIEAWGY